MLKVYHTYNKKLVPFKPIKDGKVNMYNCGPTVYDFITIGNMKYFVWCDLFRRSLEYLGYDVKQVMNITDVGHLTMTEAQKKQAELACGDLEITDTDEGLDRMEKAAKREGMSVSEIARKYAEAIFGKNYDRKRVLGKDGDLGKLNVLKPHKLPKATDHVKEQIEFIKMLEKKGFTYKTKKAVYFDITKFKKYEELTGQSIDDMKCGKRADTSDPDRKNPADFRLWQLDQPEHEMQWDSPWGRGFPGWHIECSAMSRKYLGQPFDIHTGGEDHIKLHHVNEIAQSESAYGKPMANYWLHILFLTIEGKRIGKSLGNAFIMKDIEERGFDPLDLRYIFLQAHYRSKQDFTWKALKAAKGARKRIVDFISQNKTENKGNIITKYKDEFKKKLEDNFNICEALALAWELIKSGEKNNDKVATLYDFDRVFGLDLKSIKRPEFDQEFKNKVEAMIKERSKAKRDKDWEEADRIRRNLKEKYNVILEDRGNGETRWRVD